MAQLLHSPVTLPVGGDYQRIEVTQVGGVIGAIVSGIRIGGDVEPAAVAELRAALLRHRVASCAISCTPPTPTSLPSRSCWAR